MHAMTAGLFSQGLQQRCCPFTLQHCASRASSRSLYNHKVVALNHMTSMYAAADAGMARCHSRGSCYHRWHCSCLA